MLSVVQYLASSHSVNYEFLIDGLWLVEKICLTGFCLCFRAMQDSAQGLALCSEATPDHVLRGPYVEPESNLGQICARPLPLTISLAS